MKRIIGSLAAISVIATTGLGVGLPAVVGVGVPAVAQAKWIDDPQCPEREGDPQYCYSD